MPPYYYHLKFELYPTPDPTASGPSTKGNGSSSKTTATTTTTRDDIWVPSPGASIFDDLPAHPRTRQQPTLPSPRWDLSEWGTDDDDHHHREDRHGDDHHNQYHRTRSYAAAAAGNTRVIDCGAQRGKTHVAAAAAAAGGYNYNEDDRDDDDGFAGRYGEKTPGRARRSPLPRVADGIGPGRAVRDWRFGRVRIESFDRPDAVGSEMAGKMNGDGGSGSGGEVTPAASLGPNLGGMGLATKARYLPLGTKNTEAGWGVVHLYREGDEETALGGVPEEELEGPGEGNSKGQDGVGGEEEGTMLCIPAVPSYMSPSDFLGFVGEKWRGYVSHYRMVMTSRMSRYMVLMKFRDYRRAKEGKKEFDGKPFDSVEVS